MKKQNLIGYKKKKNIRNYRKVKTNRSRRSKSYGGNLTAITMGNSVGLRGFPFPLRKNCKLQYTATHILSTGAVSVFGAEQTYRANSLYDPDQTGIGHQPYGFDTLATMYARYKVNGVRLDLGLSDPSADGIVCGLSVRPKNGGSTLAGLTMDVLREKPGVFLWPINNSGRQEMKFTKYFPMDRLMGKTKSQFKAATEFVTSLCTNNPTDEAYLSLAVCDPRGTGGLTLIVFVRLTYYCTFYDRITLPQS